MTSTSSTPRPSSRNLLVPAFTLVVVVLLAFAAFAGGGDGDTTVDTAGDAADTDPDAAPPEQPTDDGPVDLSFVERRIDGDPHAVGAVDAPVVMVEYSDFQCPFCGVFARDTHPELMERYVAEGILRIEFRDTPILGEESITAALGGRAAAAQGAFWEFHDEVFSEERERNVGELGEDRLVELAAGLGLDPDRFRADMSDPAALEAVQRDRQEAQQLGVSSTPAFLVNGRPILGAQPTEVFLTVVEEAAAEAGV
jgi:protein-disulfide isomerase